MSPLGGTGRPRSCWGQQSIPTASTCGPVVRPQHKMTSKHLTCCQIRRKTHRLHTGGAAGRQAALPGHIDHESAGSHHGGHRCVKRPLLQAMASQALAEAVAHMRRAADTGGHRGGTVALCGHNAGEPAHQRTPEAAPHVPQRFPGGGRPDGKAAAGALISAFGLVKCVRLDWTCEYLMMIASLLLTQ